MRIELSARATLTANRNEKIGEEWVEVDRSGGDEETIEVPR